MSDLLNENNSFLRLFLNTSGLQQRKLIQSLSPSQVDALAEIFMNLNSMTFNNIDRKFMNATKVKFIKKFGKGKKTSQRVKKVKLLTGFSIVVKILQHFKEKIIALLN